MGDWCSGRVFGLGWDGSRWQLEELVQTDLQFTAGGYDEQGHVLAVNCNCFYTADQGPLANPPGSLWRVVPADEVPPGAEVARTVTEAVEGAAAAGERITFLHPLDNSPLSLDKLPNEQISGQVSEFHASGANPYRGDPAAISDGKKSYTQ